jgi:hypothetical protein
MSLKIINITVPEECNLNITNFSPEENYLMLKIGSSCLLEGQKFAISLSQKDIQKKIKDEFKEEVNKLELDIILEKEITKKMEERISKMYEGQIEKLEKHIEFLSLQIKEQSNIKKEIVQKEVDEVKNKYDLLLQERDKQNQLNREVFDKAEKLITKSISKSSSAIGDDGENIFENLSETFKDFSGYKIENKSKQGHKGDFHLFFEDFNVLVDSKNYSGNVQKKEVTKIEADLMINDNMNFAWMVSLNTNICEYNRFPIMTKWITTDVGVKCILFINNLLEHKDPRNILRQAWSMCQDFYKLTKKVYKEDGELEKYRVKDLLYKKQINNLQDRVDEIRRGLNISFSILKHMDNDLLEMLSLMSNDIVKNKFEMNNKIKEWWDDNIEYVNDESKMSSTEIWNKFKKDNKEYIGENKITIESFKSMITCIISSSNYVEKSKNIIEFIGFKWKQIEVKPIDNLEFENIIIEKPKKNKKEIVENPKKVEKEKSIEFYFDEYNDKKILEEYENEKNDIITISLSNNVKPFQVISVLHRHKIISSRSYARGYNKYKETDEYNNSLKKVA